MNNKMKSNYHNIPIYVLNTIAKSIKGGRFVIIDDEYHLIFYYTPLTSDIWITNVFDVNEKGKLINIDSSKDAQYWSIPHQFMKVCNELFTFNQVDRTNAILEDKEYKTMLLSTFYGGLMNGIYGKEKKSNSNTSSWYEIKDWRIYRYMQKTYNCPEYKKGYLDVINTPKIIEKWESEEEILSFFKHNGWMLKDEYAIEYSMNYIAESIKNE